MMGAECEAQACSPPLRRFSGRAWPRLLPGPAETHTVRTLSSQVTIGCTSRAHWQLEASQRQRCGAPAQWAGGVALCGVGRPPPPPLRPSPSAARAHAGPATRAHAPHLAQPLARQLRRRRSGRARARSWRSGGRGPRRVHSRAVRRRGLWAPSSGRRKRRLQSGGGLATLGAELVLPAPRTD